MRGSDSKEMETSGSIPGSEASPQYTPRPDQNYFNAMIHYFFPLLFSQGGDATDLDWYC